MFGYVWCLSVTLSVCCTGTIFTVNLYCDVQTHKKVAIEFYLLYFGLKSELCSNYSRFYNSSYLNALHHIVVN